MWAVSGMGTGGGRSQGLQGTRWGQDLEDYWSILWFPRGGDWSVLRFRYYQSLP